MHLGQCGTGSAQHCGIPGHRPEEEDGIFGTTDQRYIQKLALTSGVGAAANKARCLQAIQIQTLCVALVRLEHAANHLVMRVARLGWGHLHQQRRITRCIGHSQLFSIVLNLPARRSGQRNT